MDVTIRGGAGTGPAGGRRRTPWSSRHSSSWRCQTIVSRENSPLDPAVVTVGSIHGGTRPNIIPDEVDLQLTVRAYKEEVRQRILASIGQIAKNTALAAGIPEDRAPIVKVVEATPATYNDPALTQRVADAIGKAIGTENVLKVPPTMGSEDFCRIRSEGAANSDLHVPARRPWTRSKDCTERANRNTLAVAPFEPVRRCPSPRSARASRP